MLNRRSFLAACSTAGLASPLFPGVLWGMAAEQPRAFWSYAPRSGSVCLDRFV